MVLAPRAILSDLSEKKMARGYYEGDGSSLLRRRSSPALLARSYMNHSRCSLCGLVVLLALGAVEAGDPAPPRKARQALQPFNVLIGDWRCTGTPVGTREEQQKGFWVEAISCQWQFKGDDAWLKLAFDKGKYFSGGELRYVPAKDVFELALRTAAKESLTFTGTLQDKKLTVERQAKEETQRLVFTLLHSNRFLYRYEVKPAGKNLFSKQYGVGATKEGEPFAAGDGKPECIVSGGRGSIAVAYMGKTFYVCCSGCRDEFLDNPQKYIKEFEEKKAKK
jgi:YHS domain-containing protein